MKKPVHLYLLWVVLWACLGNVNAQRHQGPRDSTIRSMKAFSDNKLRYESWNDRRGNMVLSMSRDPKGHVTMASIMEYDSLNRETRWYFIDQGLGCAIYETVYMSRAARTYKYVSESGTARPEVGEELQAVKNRDDLLRLDVVQQLLRGPKQLCTIYTLNPAGQTEAEYTITAKGDTSQAVYYRYDDQGRQNYFYYFTPGDDTWSWEIFDTYDTAGNMVFSYRIQGRDTTEKRYFGYDQSNRIVTKSYYNRQGFQNREEYLYDSLGRNRTELFYQDESEILDAKTEFVFNKRGHAVKKTVWDYREGGKKTVEKFVFEYW